MSHLILHKVRGEPAFDIAEKMCPGVPCQSNCGLIRDDGTCSAKDEWIIPTSGHRAYPYWHTELKVPFGIPPLPIPADWPDHYAAPDGNIVKPKIDVGAILSKLMPKIKRRI